MQPVAEGPKIFSSKLLKLTVDSGFTVAPVITLELEVVVLLNAV